MSSQTFQSLKELPTPLSDPQCVLHNHEILICGGKCKSVCYSYHILRDEYKFICSYPNDITLEGHCVVKLVDNNSKNSNEITLLSFGGNKYKHTLVMKYVSVWSNNNDNQINKSKKLKKSNNYNEWIPFTDNHSNQIHIGKDEDEYIGARAVIGGSNNHLLFITYWKNNISVFDLNTFQIIKHDTLPIKNEISYHCFVSKSENGQGQEIMKTNQEKNNIKKKKSYKMLLFCQKTGLSIEYNENKNTFRFHKLPICSDIATFHHYAYVCVNDSILFFGGYGKKAASKALHKYSMQEKTWTTIEHTFLIPFRDYFGILDEDGTHMHIIGGRNDDDISVSTHIKTKVMELMHKKTLQLSKNEIKLSIQHWIRILKIKLGWVNDFNKIIFKY
ncbi:hypothetical protein RFI_01165, partial [Reticulomyxa filosa]